VYHEARGEPIEGQVAVAHATLNRVAAARWPDDACDVVFQDGQFSWTRDDLPDHPRDVRALTRSLAVARAALAGATSDPTKGATFYHRRDVRPYWADLMLPTAELGRHVFYRDMEVLR
jgi:spore germination cell wall hydrolase CwlJ-like protein